MDDRRSSRHGAASCHPGPARQASGRSARLPCPCLDRPFHRRFARCTATCCAVVWPRSSHGCASRSRRWRVGRRVPVLAGAHRVRVDRPRSTPSRATVEPLRQLRLGRCDRRRCVDRGAPPATAHRPRAGSRVARASDRAPRDPRPSRVGGAHAVVVGGARRVTADRGDDGTGARVVDTNPDCARRTDAVGSRPRGVRRGLRARPSPRDPREPRSRHPTSGGGRAARVARAPRRGGARLWAR
jgi:hypothetical protein